MAQFFAKVQKPYIWPFLPKIGKTIIFLKNRALSLFNPWPLTSCKKSEKSYDSIPRKSRTDGRTDGTEFIRPHYRGSKNQKYEYMYQRILILTLITFEALNLIKFLSLGSYKTFVDEVN